MSSPVTLQRFPNFDVLRLFLASEVVLEHVHNFATHQVASWFPLPIMPVPSFLAISGFMVLASLERTEFHYARFWYKRALRILPAFTLSFLLVLAVAGLAGVGAAFRCYFSFHPLACPNIPLWSLSCEEAAYAAMCVLAAIGFYRNKRLVGWCALLAGALFFGLMSFDPSVYLPWQPLPMTFLIGCWFNPEASAKRGRWGVAMAVGAYAVLLLAPMRWALSETIYIGFGAWAVLLIGVSDLRLPRLKYDISYGLYVYHFPILYFLNAQGASPAAVCTLGPALSVGLAYLSAKYVERPFLMLKERSTAALKTRVKDLETQPAAAM